MDGGRHYGMDSINGSETTNRLHTGIPKTTTTVSKDQPSDHEVQHLYNEPNNMALTDAGESS